MSKTYILYEIKRNVRALQYADESLKKDKEVVLAAVKQNGCVLKYADESLKKDKKIILEAVRQLGGLSLQYADESLLKDKDFMIELSKYTIFAFRYVNNGILTGKEFNELFPHVQLRKKIKDDMIMHQFKYQIGLNVDTIPFNPTDECKPGGLYFTDDKHIDYFSDGDYGKNIYQ